MYISVWHRSSFLNQGSCFDAFYFSRFIEFQIYTKISPEKPHAFSRFTFTRNIYFLKNQIIFKPPKNPRVVISGIISTKFRRLSDYVEYDYFRLILAGFVLSNLFGWYFTALALVISLIFYFQSRVMMSSMFSLTIMLGRSLNFHIAYVCEIFIFQCSESSHC